MFDYIPQGLLHNLKPHDQERVSVRRAQLISFHAMYFRDAKNLSVALQSVFGSDLNVTRVELLFGAM